MDTVKQRYSMVVSSYTFRIPYSKLTCSAITIKKIFKFLLNLVNYRKSALLSLTLIWVKRAIYNMCRPNWFIGMRRKTMIKAAGNTGSYFTTTWGFGLGLWQWCRNSDAGSSLKPASNQL